MVLRLSLNSSQSLWWHSDYLYTHHNLPGGPENPYTHHSLHGRTQRISVRFTVSLVVLRIPLYSSLSPWWYSDYPYTHNSLPYETQISLLTTVSKVEVRLSFYTSQSPWLHSVCHDHSFPGGTQTIPSHITVFLKVLRLSLY